MSRERAVEAGLHLPGWRYADDLSRVWDLAVALDPGAELVEVGCFLVRTTVVLAHARQASSGMPVRVVDPLDGRGEPFSEPHYATILDAQGGRSQQQALVTALDSLSLTPWADLWVMTAERAGASWTGPVGMLVLDGDQSPGGAASAWDAWQRHLADDAVVLLGNSAEREYAPGHDGHALLLERLAASGRWCVAHRGDTSVLRAVRRASVSE